MREGGGGRGQGGVEWDGSKKSKPIPALPLSVVWG